MAVAEMEQHRWTREEYERMAEAGFFHPEARLELIEGIVYDMAPQGSLHTTVVHALIEALRQALPGSYIRVQSPLALGENSEPEPDVAIVPGSLWDYEDKHPSTALLVAEVSRQSLLHDRGKKRPAYARHGIPECWILNLRNKTLEVYRDPSGERYRTQLLLKAGDTVSPLARPEAVIAVADLLP
ncbi:MAG: Uma2 family endonuclease [Thermoanaerobaculia bacterium]